jgi:hypothetical protein
MPGAVIEIDPQEYPTLAELEDGEQATLKVVATKATTDEGMIEFTTDSIEPTQVNPAKKALKGLKGQSGGIGVKSNADPELEESFV